MNDLRLMIISLAALLALGACGNGDEAVVDASGQASNALLAHVPSDTPYVFANLEPMPEEVLDTFLTRAQPLIDTLQSQLATARSEMETAADPDSGDPGAALALALMQELDGNLSRAGLESLGFDLLSSKVVYGMGAFPVIRLGLSDPAVLRATILRVMENAGLSAPEQEYQGVSFWRISDGPAEHSPAGLYVSILDDHLAIGILPPMEEEQQLPAFLGLEKPADSDALTRLAQLNRAQGYTPYGSGIVDMHRLADEIMQPGSSLARVMAATGEFDASTLDEQCVTEIHSIIDHAPRMTTGVLELTPSVVAVQYRVETPETLAGQLADLVSRIPMASAVSDRVLEFAFGMRFGPVRDFLREKAGAIVEQPYQCEQLQDMNIRAAELMAKIDQPMPPFLNNFQGVRVSLNEIMMSGESLSDTAQGHLALHVEKPEMFIGMAQMFLPDLSGLSITPGDPPVRLPETMMPQPGIVAWAAMNSDAIGLAVGEGEEAGLTEFLEQEAGPEGMFLSAGYDMAAYLDYSEVMASRYQPDNAANDGYTHPHSQAAEELREAATRAFRDMADRSYTTLRFSSEGFIAENRMTFK